MNDSSLIRCHWFKFDLFYYKIDFDMLEKIKKIVYKALPYAMGACAVALIGVFLLCIWSLIFE